MTKFPAQYTMARLVHTAPGSFNLHMYHTFMELFKILKFDVPQSIKDLFKFCPRNDKLRLIVPLMRLDVSQQNFLYTSTKIWNDLIPYVFEICDANEDGIIIPGSSKNPKIQKKIQTYQPRQVLLNPTLKSICYPSKIEMTLIHGN